MIDEGIPNSLTRVELAKALLKSLVDKESKRKWRKYRREKARIRMLNRECRESKSALKDLFEVCLQDFSPVTSPLVLISQIQRSGGTLLAQLFDSHPEIHAHPHELKIGKPKKYIWPKIDLNDNFERWFYILFEDDTIEHFKRGYRKERKQKETFSFIFLPSLQKKIFLKYLDSLASIKLRDIFDAYMTSYFGAWLNYQNLHGHKKYVTAFTARLAMDQNNMQSFFEVYPDGRLISVIRDPKNWFPSALRHDKHIKRDKYTDMNFAFSQWRKSALATLWNKKTYGERVCVIRFEDLVGKTEAVMRFLSEFLAIGFGRHLLIPTFNGFPIKANTSFESEQPGIVKSTLARHKTLTREELDLIDKNTRDEYQKILDFVVAF